jgi:hypothetical protein
MTTDDQRPLEAGHGASAPDDDPEGVISLGPLVATLWRYRLVIAALVGLTVIVYAGAGAVVYLTAPVERQARVEFQLMFDGADLGRYPNGLTFSEEEVVSTAVLTEVYELNELDRYLPYDAFKGAMFVLWESDELETLARQYQTTLTDPRLTVIERTRLEEEFRGKRNALRVQSYMLSYIRERRERDIPDDLLRKVLSDVLTVWAEQAAERKGVMRYDIESYTSSLLADAYPEEDYLVRAEVLREVIDETRMGLARVAELPGAHLIRVGPEGASLADIREGLNRLASVRLRPVSSLIDAVGLSQDPDGLLRYAQWRLFQVRLDEQEAARRVVLLRESLRDFTSGQPVAAARDGSGGTAPATVVPQLGDAFFDRLLSLMSDFGRVEEYRQGLTEEIIDEGQRAVSLETDVAYYEDFLELVERVGRNARRDDLATARVEAAKDVEAQLDAVHRGVVTAIERTNELYRDISALNLGAQTNLYAIVQPVSVRLDHAVSPRAMMLDTLLAGALGLLLVPLGCLVHHYVTLRFRRPTVSGPSRSVPPSS